MVSNKKESQFKLMHPDIASVNCVSSPRTKITLTFVDPTSLAAPDQSNAEIKSLLLGDSTKASLPVVLRGVYVVLDYLYERYH